MSETQLAAAEEMHRALGRVPCICVYEHPYAPRGKLLKQCGPCKAIAQWKKARAGYVDLQAGGG